MIVELLMQKEADLKVYSFSFNLLEFLFYEMAFGQIIIYFLNKKIR